MKTFRKALYILIAVIGVASAIILPASGAGTLAYGAATVSATELNVRSAPDTAASVVTSLSEDTIVVILEKTSDAWFEVNYNGTVGYASTDYFKNVLTKENFCATGTLNATDVFMRNAPATSGKVLGTYGSGVQMPVIGINEGWYKVNYDGKTGYIRSDLMDITSGYTPAAPTSAAGASLGQQIANYAQQFVGSRYVYGGESPSGFDCSGFTQYMYKHFGISISRTASQQYRDNGVKVSKSELQPGDLVFFSHNGGVSIAHVGMYIGDGKFVHASTSKTGVIISSLGSTNYTIDWYGAKRIVS